MATDEWIVKNMEKDYPNNGFRVYEHMNMNWVERHHGRPANPAKPDIDIIRFDFMSASMPRADPEGIRVFVDWNWANEFGIEAGLGTGTILVDANLSGADFTGANLSGADLRGANLNGAILKCSNNEVCN